MEREGREGPEEMPGEGGAHLQECTRSAGGGSRARGPGASDHPGKGGLFGAQVSETARSGELRKDDEAFGSEEQGHVLLRLRNEEVRGVVSQTGGRGSNGWQEPRR